MEKLIRDAIPDIAKSKWETLCTRLVQWNNEYIEFLLRKIDEELDEFNSANWEEKIIEACDVMEVYDSLIWAYSERKDMPKAEEFKQDQQVFIAMCIDEYKMDVDRILEEQIKKRTTKGWFKKWIIWIF